MPVKSVKRISNKKYSTKYPHRNHISSTTSIIEDSFLKTNDTTEKIDTPIVNYSYKESTEKYSTIFVNLSHVSSTVMIIEDEQHKPLPDENKTNDLQKQNTKILKEEEWVLPIIIITVMLILILICYEIFYCLERRQHLTKSENTLLSQVLLLGLLSCVVISLLYTLQPSPGICLAIRVGSSLSCTIVYATLLVKMITSISLNSGIHLHPTYQVILLFFVIIIQVVIGIQWLVAAPPDVLAVNSSSLSCTETFTQQLYTQIYNIFLIIVLTILSLKFCTARPVSREILYSSFTSVLSTIIWSIWIGAGYILPSHYSDISSSVTILSSVVIIFSATLLSRAISEGKVIPGTSTSLSIFTGNDNSKGRL